MTTEVTDEVAKKVKARQIMEYVIGGWLDFANVRFIFDALPEGSASRYDGPGYVLHIEDGKHVWKRDDSRCMNVPLHPDDLMLSRGGIFFRALMDMPCPLDTIRLIAPFRNGSTGLVAAFMHALEPEVKS